MSKLKGFCKIIPGYAFKSSDFNNGNSKVIKIADIEEHINCSQLGAVYSEGKDLEKYKVQNGDFVMSMTSATQIGKIGIVENVVVDTYINQRLCKFSDFSNEVEPLYIYYVITQPQFNKFIRNSADSKSLQQNISHNTIGEYPIVLPDITTQKRIAKTLSIIDNKISTNNRINAELESMAKTIYDYWFTQFDFPDENGKPYRSSGGKMVWNEELKREIPEGWEVGSLYDIADFINGLACQKFRPTDELHKLPVIKIKEMHDGITDNTEYVKDSIPEKHIIADGDILFSWSATLETMIWTGGRAGLNQHIFKVISKMNAKYYVYMQLSAYIINFIQMAEARKTTMGHITTDHLKQSKIILPPQDIVDSFNDFVSVLFEKCISNDTQIRNLASLRDWLLPMLMNGQVGFKEDT